MDIEEIPTVRLEKELIRRKSLLNRKKCPYCYKELDTHNCKMKNRMDNYLGTTWEIEANDK